RALPDDPAGRAHGDGLERLDRRDVRPRLRQAEDDRAPARLPGQLRRVRALVRVHPLARRRRPAGRVGDRGPQRQLPACAPAAGGRGRAAAARLRQALRARVRAQRRADEARARDQDARPRQAAARPRLPPADGVLPAAGRRGAAHRADRDRDEGDPRRLRRRRRRDPSRGQGRPRDRQERAVHHAGPPAGRGGRGQAPGHPPAPV
ncbi:MAG: Glycine dehydrogenase [decarboxylating] (glycine cleavage system P2 protein), partial [uncultured Solirubrobacteraceae bacterium]